MREIKFRAWDNQNNKIFYVKSVTMNRDLVNQIIIIGRRELPVIASRSYSQFGSNKTDIIFAPNFELMQFTGLLDKNGREIYEGDIVKTPSYPKKYQESEVIFIDGSFAIYLDDTTLYGSNDAKGRGWIEISQYSYGTKDDFEVIGNIYENKELLK